MWNVYLIVLALVHMPMGSDYYLPTIVTKVEIGADCPFLKKKILKELPTAKVFCTYVHGDME